MTAPRLISNSEIQQFKRCRRKWWLSSYRNLELAATSFVGNRELGTKVHAALASWYVPDGEERAHPVAALDALTEADRAEIARLDEDPDVVAAKLKEYDKEADLARAMVEGYVEWIAETGADSDLVVVAPEQPLAYEIEDGVYLVGRLDVQLRREHDGVHLLLDHKTTGSFDQLTARLRQDEQMLTYEMLLVLNTSMDERVAGALYNMLRKVKRTARAKPPFYKRAEVHHNEHELRAFWHRTLGTVNEILDAQKRLDAGAPPLRVAYPTPSHTCSWDCDFAAVCPMFDDGSRAEDMLANLYHEKPADNRYRDLEFT